MLRASQRDGFKTGGDDGFYFVTVHGSQPPVGGVAVVAKTPIFPAQSLWESEKCTPKTSTFSGSPLKWESCGGRTGPTGHRLKWH